MGMNRRSFLDLLAVAPVAIAAAPLGPQYRPDPNYADHRFKLGETIHVKKPMRYSMLGDPDILRAQHELNRIASLHQEELQERYFRPAAEAIHQAMLADHGKLLVAFGGIL